ncbi:type II secretion system F family protein [Candidatus Micrarchaeota archaeon]|nr:type II secretion system F family protein [Candidatus Micrarchaeota archaeon]
MAKNQNKKSRRKKANAAAASQNVNQQIIQTIATKKTEAQKTNPAIGPKDGSKIASPITLNTSAFSTVKSPIRQPSIKAYVPAQVQGKGFMPGIYFFLSKFATRSQKQSLREKMLLAGIDSEAELWLGEVLLLSKLCAFATFMLFWVIFKEALIFKLLLFAFIAFGLVLFTAVIHLNIRIEDRKNRLEAILPDAMQVISANIRSGMSPVVALRASARPEFGPLQEDIKYATTKSLGTGSFSDALNEMGKKTSSELFQRIVALFSASLRSGGKLASLLENTANDIRDTQELKRELVSNTRLYAIFIIFTVVIGTPLLLAVSIQFGSMVNNLQAKTSSGSIASDFTTIPLISSPLKQDFLEHSAFVILLITTFLASALLGVMNNGSYASGLKYFPALSIAAVLFFIFMKDFALKAILPIAGI